MLVTYVMLDPCNPPRELILRWREGNNWNHNTTWGEPLIFYSAQTQRWPLPPVGQWVRFEVPASVPGLENKVLNGMSFGIYGGRAWFDAPGRASCAMSVTPVEPQPGDQLWAPLGSGLLP